MFLMRYTRAIDHLTKEAAMRSFFILTVAFLIPYTARAQESHLGHQGGKHNNLRQSQSIEPAFKKTAHTTAVTQSTQLGDAGYRHGELHQNGVIQELMDRTGNTCCEGEESDECRVTVLRYISGKPEAWLDGKWCPLHNTRVYYDIPLIKNAQAVVCAGEDNYQGCGAVYCAAADTGY